MPRGVGRANMAALVKETKQANPNALVMMYSNGASAISDWRTNGFDLEAVAREGFLDSSWTRRGQARGTRREFAG